MPNLIFPNDIPSKANPIDADLLLIADTEDNSELKKITIGSIATDIWDDLIVDGSESATTTYSSVKINDLNDAQDTTISGNYTTLNNAKANKAGDTFTGQVKLAKGADIASAAVVNLWAATGNFVDITWVITITSLWTTTAGTQVKVRFTGALLLTHNATSLILPTGANITTIANDTAEFVSLGSGNWRCVSYLRYDWSPLTSFDTTTLVTGLTEDTVGDMDADFLFAYDTGGTANKKQKPNVYRASDAEAKAGTATNKFLTPAQNEMVWQYGVSTNLLNEWYTIQTPWATWTTTGLSPATFNAGGYWTFTAASDGKTSTLIPWSGSTAQYSPAQSKDIRIKIRCKFNNGAGFWLCISGWNVNTADTDVTNWLVRFTKYGGNLFAHNSNWTTKTSTDVNSWITLTDWNTYEIVFNPWVDAKFYINGVLKATHTTNLPTTGTLNLSIHKWDTGTIETFPPIISFEL